MKKLLAILLCAALALLPALAEAPATEPPVADSPAPDETPQAPDDAPAHDISSGETITLQLPEGPVTLDFDSSTQYSTIEGGLVQASFYSYSADGATLYELYIVFPDTVQPGMVITPEYAALTNEESSVVLIISDTRTQAEQYFFASLMDGGIYPEGSNYTIAINDLYESDGATTFDGSLSATLVALDMASGEVAATLSFPETPFHFTIGGAQGRHADPMPTAMPNDLRKV